MSVNVLNKEEASMFHSVNFKISLRKLTFISLLLIISFPIKSVSLLYLIIYNLYFIFQVSYKKIIIDKLILFYLLFLFIFQCVLVSYLYSPLFIFNVLLFFIFISPLLWFIVIDKKKSKLNLSRQDIKDVIESYLKIQIFFSFINILYRVAIRGLSFDTDFGDIVAGTFRIPFSYKADVSNPIFALTLTCILFIYIFIYTKEVNKILILFSFLILFLASVNHLILAMLLSLAVAYLNRYFFKIFIISIVVYFLYSILQPGNFSMILERLNKIFQLFSSMEMLNKIGFKGQYLYRWINDYIEHPFLFSFSGMGAGTYSSRAAMFFSGDYIQSFPFKNMTYFMEDNTYYLWRKFLLAPAWMQGSFNYPFNSLFTFIAEIGLLNVVILGSLFWKRLKRCNLYTFSQRLFFIILFFLLGLVDNYYEYFQVFFFIYILNVSIQEANVRTRIKVSE